MAGCCSAHSSSSWQGTGREASPPCVSPRTNRRCRKLRRTVWGPVRWGKGTAGNGYVGTCSPAWLLFRSQTLSSKRDTVLNTESASASLWCWFKNGSESTADPVDQSGCGSGERWGGFRDTASVKSRWSSCEMGAAASCCGDWSSLTHEWWWSREKGEKEGIRDVWEVEQRLEGNLEKVSMWGARRWGEVSGRTVVEWRSGYSGVEKDEVFNHFQRAREETDVQVRGCRRKSSPREQQSSSSDRNLSILTAEWGVWPHTSPLTEMPLELMLPLSPRCVCSSCATTAASHSDEDKRLNLIPGILKVISPVLRAHPVPQPVPPPRCEGLSLQRSD